MATNRNKYDYNELIKDFGEKKITERYSTLYSYMESFIERSGYKENVVIANSVLNQVVIDYFSDIHRMKNFHDIHRTNFLKIRAYSAYWILRRKPLQIIKDNDEDIELAFVNENFVSAYLITYMCKKNTDAVILPDDREMYEEFLNNLQYYLRYRVVTPQMIETMMESYRAGMAFERAVDL